MCACISLLHYQFIYEMSGPELHHVLVRNATLRMPLRRSRSTSRRWAKCTGRTGKRCRGSRPETSCLVTSSKWLVSWTALHFVCYRRSLLCVVDTREPEHSDGTFGLAHTGYHMNLEKIGNLILLQLLISMFLWEWCVFLDQRRDVGFWYHGLAVPQVVAPCMSCVFQDVLINPSSWSANAISLTQKGLISATCCSCILPPKSHLNTLFHFFSDAYCRGPVSLY